VVRLAQLINSAEPPVKLCDSRLIDGFSHNFCFLEQATAVPDLFSRGSFVPSQHPDFDARISVVFNAFFHVFLEKVLYASHSEQLQILLNLSVCDSRDINFRNFFPPENQSSQTLRSLPFDLSANRLIIATV
jgi:hypothetical protein